MDGQYPPPMPPLGAYYPSSYPTMLPPDAIPQTRLHRLQTLSMENLGTYAEYEDPGRANIPPQTQPRSRRRQPQGAEHVKHRRTRSGCYTCRQRRVKCDETHPVCERCRKGKRECNYPGAESASTGSKLKKTKGSPGSSPSGSDIDNDEKEPLSAIADVDEDDMLDEEPASPSSDSRKPSTASSANLDRSTSPSADAAAPPKRPQPVRTSSRRSSKAEVSGSPRWSSLSKEVRYYLNFHREHMSHHHYAFKYDGGDFLKTTFVDIALNDGSGALLHAIVAFAAYHHSVARDNSNISTFLSHYNKSITYLQASLKKRRHNVATLLTILQLATVEEFLGDWVNLLGHQKAAHQILTDLFTPQTIMQDETRRKIITWYLRFDLMLGMMSGAETVLGREWFEASADFYKRQAKDKPNDLGAQFEEYFAVCRLLATDVTILFNGKSKNMISDGQFESGVDKLSNDFEEFGRRLENAFSDSSCYAKTFPNAPSPSEEDLFGFRDPNFLYSGELTTMNFVLTDFWAIHLMFRLQLCLAKGQPPSADLAEVAMKKCKMFEAIQYGGDGGLTAILGCQASLGIVCLFLPREQKYTRWCQNKLACIEQLGYVYPTAFRKRMSDHWNEDVTHWWLPDDEGFPSTIRTLREFVQYRNTQPKDALTTGISNMSGIFRSLNIDEHGFSDDLRSTETGSESNASPHLHDHSPPRPCTGAQNAHEHNNFGQGEELASVQSA